MADQTAVFATKDVGRIFIACDRCNRVMPHYRVYGSKVTKPSDGRCKCGGTIFRPKRINELYAMWLVLVVGWFWRHTIKDYPEWDPRMPIRTEHNTAVFPS